MNTSQAIELALAETIRKYAEMGEDVTIRAWQSLEADGSWKSNPDRKFPMIDVRCAPPKTDDNQSTLQVECEILMRTKTDDDISHAFIVKMYTAVQSLVDKMFSQFRSGVFTGKEIAFFLASIVSETSADLFQFGGLTFGDGLAPADDGGINMIGITLIVQYGRSDF